MASARRTWLPGTLRSWPSPPPLGPLCILVEVILGVGLRGLLSIFRNLIFSVRIVRIFCFDIGERIKRTRTRLLGTELLGELIIIGVGGQVLELSGYFCCLAF